jgi:16S rRNA U1498 N3-methylase RsmE
MINAASRLNGVKEKINNAHYFVIRAARQSGKTTLPSRSRQTP